MRAFQGFITCLAIGASLTLFSASASSQTYLAVGTYSYDEPDVMTVTSQWPTISAGYQRHMKHGTAGGHESWGVDLELGMGYVQYRGSGRQSHFYSMGRAEFHLPILHLPISHRSMGLGIYSGLGYRYLFDDFGPGTTTTGASTYDRISQYVYLPLGIESAVGPNGRTRLQANLLLQGRQESMLTEVVGYLNDASNEQRRGWGLDLSFQSTKGGPEYVLRYWEIADSNIVPVRTTQSLLGVYEPKNNTLEIGVRLFMP